MIIKNKIIEFERVYFSNTKSVGFQIVKTSKTDHAGLSIKLDLIFTGFAFQIYDQRHWDEENNKWYDYNKNSK